MPRLLFVAVLAIVSISTFYEYPHAEDIDINTILMNSTFKLVCDSRRGPGQISCGTVFFLEVQLEDDPKVSPKPVLVTAGHVLSDCTGDTAKLYLRKKHGDRFVKFEYPIDIRSEGKDMWVRHPDVDVAVMAIKKFPPDAYFMLAGTNILSTDNTYNYYDIHPGTDVSVMGFPLCIDSNAAGFPVLRQGKISSYPLVPGNVYKTFLVDVNVLGGNSGGPVYFYDPYWRKAGSGKISAPARAQTILGLISKNNEIELAGVINSHYIKETIDRLPP